ncbi:unnamed protein product [Rotaria sp. Silwood2]|nr:unnamed protein product [Rotaria sp. Silwood2]
MHIIADVLTLLLSHLMLEIDYKRHTTPSIQVIANPLLSQQFSPIHKQVFSNLAQLNVNYARYAAWFAYPRLTVAELDPPSGIYQCGNVEQNFSIKLSCREGGGVISQVDFASYGTATGACGQMQQGKCHASSSSDVVQQVCIGQEECIIPATLEVDWFYDEGSLLIDQTIKDLGDYYGRLFAWYMDGGFIDEYGRDHVSNHFYDWDYTEIFNEVESEHTMNPESYTRAYDAVIQGIRRHTNNTQMKYVGLSLGGHNEFEWYRYFLNHSNHAPNIPLDMIAYHFYAWSESRTDPLDYEALFEQLDTFTFEVEQIEEIRKSLSPETRTTIDELGVILADDNTPGVPQFPLIFWNAAGVLYAYSWAKLSQQGIDVVGQSQLVGYPKLSNLQLQPQYPSVSMVNWTTGAGTAKYWISKLLIDTAEIDSDQAVRTQTSDLNGKYVFSQGFICRNGQRWVLIINKRFANVDVFLPGATGGKLEVVNEASGFGPAIITELPLSRITLTPFAVAVVHMPLMDVNI